MPVARRKYDITPTEMDEIARAAVDSVVALVRERADELAPSQVQRIEEVAAWMARTVAEAAQQTYAAQTERIAADLAGIRDEVAGGLAEQAASIVHAVEARLASVNTAALEDRLPGRVAEAVAGVLPTASDVPADLVARLERLEAVAQRQLAATEASETARSRAADRADELVRDMRTAVSEDAVRRHKVLLDVLDERLSELRLTEMADDLPGRIGTVISDAIERSHKLQVEALDQMRDELARALEAGLDRQRAAIVELAAVGDRLTAFADEVTTTVERTVSAAFERSQAAQMQRISALVRDMRDQQAEALEAHSASVDDRLAAQAAAQAASLDAQTSALEARSLALEALLDAGSSALATRLDDQAARVEERLDHQTERLRQLLDIESANVRSRLDAHHDHVAERLGAAPSEVAAAVDERLQAVVDDAGRVQRLLEELAWALGEVRAGSAGLRDELARAVTELPDAVAALQDAAIRSEARIADVAARLATPH